MTPAVKAVPPPDEAPFKLSRPQLDTLRRAVVELLAGTIEMDSDTREWIRGWLAEAALVLSEVENRGPR